jgi:hypothetical protein
MTVIIARSIAQRYSCSIKRALPVPRKSEEKSESKASDSARKRKKVFYNEVQMGLLYNLQIRRVKRQKRGFSSSKILPFDKCKH